MTKHIPYSEHPPVPFEWVDSGQRIILENRGFPIADIVWDAVHPCCPEHGLMAQGFDYWYCEACDAALVRMGWGVAS